MRVVKPPESVHCKTLTTSLAGVMKHTRSTFKYSESAHLPVESQTSINPYVGCQQRKKRLFRQQNIDICTQVL